VRYGDEAVELLRANGPLVSLVLAVVVLLGVGTYILMRRATAADV